jgi:Flp pilus assembly protein TadD
VNRPRDARAAYEETIALAPTFTAARINLGILLANTGKMEEAIEQFEAVLQIDPNDPRARSALEQLDVVQRARP